MTTTRRLFQKRYLILVILYGAGRVAAFPSQAAQRSRVPHPSPGFADARSRDSRLQAAGLLHVFAKPAPPPPPSAAQLMDKKIRELASHSTVVGSVKNVFAKFRLTPGKTKLILGGISHAVHWEELLFFSFMGWFFVPLFAIPNNFVRKRILKNARSFDRSYTKVVADQFAQASRIGFVVYIVDILEIVLQAIGFKFAYLRRSPHIVAQSLFTWWIVNRIAHLKRYILAIQTRHDPGELVGSASLVDHLIDAFLYGIGAFVLLNSIQQEMGAVTTGFAALGGLSTIVISLASQGLVTQVFYGLFLATSQKFSTGDVVNFGDGKVKGRVASLGWMDTLVRGPDGIMVSVPNKELADKPIRNLSRVPISSVNQQLHFKYSDADKLPKLMEDIKDEIRKACPDVVDDGSRNFRAYWTGYGTISLEAYVEAHFRIKLLGDDFWQNRQNMLVAIHRAVKNNGMEFAVADEELLKAIYKNVR